MARNKGVDDQGTGPEHDEVLDAEGYLASLIEEAQGWWVAQKELLTLQVYRKLGNTAGELLALVLTALAVVLVVVFASLALAYWLGGLLNSTAFGLLVVAGIYLVVLLAVHFLLGNRLRRFVTLKVINLLYHERD